MTEPKRDVSASVDFLRMWSMNGPWALTAIDPTRRKLEGALFQCDEEDKLRAWLDEQGEAKRNIYFSVNPVIESKFQTKADRQGIDKVSHLQVDIDPRAGEDLESERARIKKLVDTPQKGCPKPSVCVFSGGGYQIYFKLETPIEIGGDINKAESAKLYNMQLEYLYGGDQTHDVSRIFRLPGSLNYPNKIKRAKGQQVELAKVIYFDEDLTYPLSAFTKAAGVQETGSEKGFSNSGNITISGNLKPAEDIDEIIKWAEDAGGEIPDHILILIGQGDDPDDPGRYNGDRSLALFACVCGLVRAKLSDDQIYSIITDKTWYISKSVLDKGSSVERYAKRQIARAHDHAIDKDLALMNKRHAVIRNYGGKCVVIEEVYDAFMDRENMTVQSFGAIRDSYCHLKVCIGDDGDGNKKYAELGKWWIKHPSRLQYNHIVFSPNGDVEGAYNLWRGFSCEAVPGDCELLLAHIEKNVCGGDKGYYEYLINWMARTVQFPATTGDTAVILRGDQGTGKGVMINALGSLFGRHYMQVSNSSHLVGNFNKHLRDCCLLFADEAFFAGDKKHEGVLKALITERYLAVEAKGFDVEPSPNFIHLMMASNSDWVVPAGMNERRFFVLDVKPHHMQDTKYFSKITEQLNNGGRQALLHFLQSRDLKGYDHRAIPKTGALQQQKELSMHPEESWWYNKLVTGALITNGDQWTQRVSRGQLQFDYVEYMKGLGQQRKHSPTVLGRFLNKFTPTRYPKKQKEVMQDHVTGEDRMIAIYLFPDLDECRNHWDANYFKGEWIEEITKKSSPAPF